MTLPSVAKTSGEWRPFINQIPLQHNTQLALIRPSKLSPRCKKTVKAGKDMNVLVLKHMPWLYKAMNERNVHNYLTSQLYRLHASRRRTMFLYSAENGHIVRTINVTTTVSSDSDVMNVTHHIENMQHSRHLLQAF